MFKYLKSMIGETYWCKMFHSAYGTSDNKWHCDKCNITYDKRLGDDDTGRHLL